LTWTDKQVHLKRPDANFEDTPDQTLSISIHEQIADLPTLQDTQDKDTQDTSQGLREIHTWILKLAGELNQITKAEVKHFLEDALPKAETYIWTSTGFEIGAESE
jgi:hypothetical protein